MQQKGLFFMLKSSRIIFCTFGQEMGFSTNKDGGITLRIGNTDTEKMRSDVGRIGNDMRITLNSRKWESK